MFCNVEATVTDKGQTLTVTLIWTREATLELIVLLGALWPAVTHLARVQAHAGSATSDKYNGILKGSSGIEILYPIKKQSKTEDQPLRSHPKFFEDDKICQKIYSRRYKV